ncbi:hypothetical protein [Prochlorococcus sp. MIT 1307]|uniref:hypothetical protein n=1 Tax=Prochlorococcus sp. MIT 1307 TaxID=3096219 RepID=UPI002A756A59|nr:hypothetical protein [Prochlorococcus sp. MIT 1307]
MQSQVRSSEIELKDRLKQIASKKWENLSDRQKSFAKKTWGILTYKWRWQIAMNIPYLAIFLLDRTIPAVHKFDMALLAKITSNLPIPAFLSSWIG